jgi:hypothetical protein
MGTQNTPHKDGKTKYSTHGKSNQTMSYFKTRKSQNTGKKERIKTLGFENWDLILSYHILLKNVEGFQI